MHLSGRSGPAAGQKRGESLHPYIYGICIPSARKIFAAAPSIRERVQGVERREDGPGSAYNYRGEYKVEFTLRCARLILASTPPGHRSSLLQSAIEGLPVARHRTHTNARPRNCKASVMVKKSRLGRPPPLRRTPIVMSPPWLTNRAEKEESKAPATPEGRAQSASA